MRILTTHGLGPCDSAYVLLRRGERLFAPFPPAHGLAHGAAQVSGRSLGQGVERLGAHAAPNSVLLEWITTPVAFWRCRRTSRLPPTIVSSRYVPVACAR